MRQDYVEFERRRALIIVLGPDGPNAFRRYWQQEQMPFIGCADIKSRVASQFAQEVNLLKLGRMPAVFIIDRAGYIRYLHYGSSMSDIPPNQELLGVLDNLEE